MDNKHKNTFLGHDLQHGISTK